MTEATDGERIDDNWERLDGLTQQLSHHVYDGKNWIKQQVKSHPIIKNLQLRVYRPGYESMGYPKPNRIHPIMENRLADTRAQVVMIGPSLAVRLGIRREEMINTSTEVKTASGGLLKILGRIPIILSLSLEDNREMKETHQMAYIIVGGT